MKLPIYVGISPTLHIRGIIAEENIKKGQIIERCPVIVYTYEEAEIIRPTLIEQYSFAWDDTHEGMVLGYGSLYNHSYTPNVEVDFDYPNVEAFYTALCDIRAGEELFINYNAETDEPIDEKYFEFDKRLKENTKKVK